MKKHPVFLLTALCVLLYGHSASGRSGESQYTPPEGLVEGGSFMDLIEPLPAGGSFRSDVWGGDNVIPRNVHNGIEDEEFSYWGGNIVKGDDGKYHMFVCRWPESIYKSEEKQGHMLWWSSTVVHAVSDDPIGPFKVLREVGRGHNPEIYRRKDGSYVIGVMNTRAFEAKTLDGPWREIEASFEWLDPDKPQNKSNRTYVPREDGSVLMMSKNGVIFISEKGDEHFKQVTAGSVYHKVPGAKFEDPVIWKDEVQYHCVYNDWYGRTAFYIRSPDGINWKFEPGLAYIPSKLMRYEDGRQEGWFKYERVKVLQDRYGRATHINWAVIDCVKREDLANDNHSSKNVVMSLTVPRRLQILNREAITPETREIRLRILAEEGFDPQQDVVVDSLRCGADEVVNFGRGCKVLRIEKSGKDLIVIFDGSGNGITEKNFTAKLLGRDKKGKLLFGYAKLPASVACVRAGPPPLFPMDHVFKSEKDPGKLAVLLKELGYAGVCTTPALFTPEQAEAMDKHGLKIMATYVRAPTKGTSIPEELVEHFRLLKGRDTVVWVVVPGTKDEERAVAAIRMVCDAAEEHGLNKVVLYQHVGASTATIASCLRLVEQVERPNLKLSFVLCHFLRQNDVSKLDAALVAAAPHLGLVQINGADRTSESMKTKKGKAAWREFIQPLGQGNFDMACFLKRLDELGYQGPFAFQTYSLSGPASEYLKQSMDAWKELHKHK